MFTIMCKFVNLIEEQAFQYEYISMQVLMCVDCIHHVLPGNTIERLKNNVAFGH